MFLKIKLTEWMAGRSVAIIHKETAKRMNVHVDDRITLKIGSRKHIAVVDLAMDMFKEDEIAVSQEVSKSLNAKKNEKVEVGIAPRPRSIEIIHKKLDGLSLNKEEIKEVITDIVNNALTEAEISYFVSAVYKSDLSIKETAFLIESILETGKKLNLKAGLIADKHSIGGIPGNRTTPIVVSICAAAGLTMPKTSSRAITTAAGTADTIESLADVEFSIPQLEKIVNAVGACLVWGGNLGLAPADDKIIQVERLLHLDPEAQLIASILAKKLAVRATHILIDIPYGKTAKVSLEKAQSLKKKFGELAKFFRVKLKCVLTEGKEPIGNGIGPFLEMNDILSVLRRDKDRPIDLEEKSIFLASEMFELTGVGKNKKEGIQIAKRLLDSGEAFKKFKEIIFMQNGRIKELEPGKFRKDIVSEKSGELIEFDNKRVNLLARICGAPADKAAGLYLYKHLGNNIKKGEKIMTLYAESGDRLSDALSYFKKNTIFIIK